jgi:hypothetical protein
MSSAVATDDWDITYEEAPGLTSSYETRSKDYGGIAVGAQAAVGTNFKISKLLSLFGEINIDGLSWAPTKGKYTKYTVNGVDQLPDMGANEKTWVYVISRDNTAIPTGDPDKRVKTNYSFTNAGLLVGVRLNFGK